MADKAYSQQAVGLLVPDPRITSDTLVAKTAGTLPSVFTQAGARPGSPAAGRDTMARLAATGTQGEDGDLEILVKRAGSPGPEEAGFVWRDVEAGDTTSKYKGWDGPQLVTGWETLYYSTTAVGYQIWPDAIRLQSRRLLAAYNSSTLGVVQISRFDPSTGAWTAANLSPDGAGTGYIAVGCSLTQLSSGRVLAAVVAANADQVDIYYSDDEGATWAILGRRVLRTVVPATDVREIRLRAGVAGDLLLLISYVTGGNWTLIQYASDDLGAHFRRVGGNPSGKNPHNPSAEPLDGGGFAVLYRSTNIYALTIASAWDDVETSSATTLVASLSDVSLWRDEDGVYYHAVNKFGVSSVILIYSSVDGVEWTQFSGAIKDTAASDNLIRYAAASTGGRTALVTRWTSSVATFDEQSVGVVWLGGYTSHTAPVGLNASTENDTDHISWSDDVRISGASGHEGEVWLPIEEPGDNGWTLTGVGTDTLSSAGLTIATTLGAADQRHYTQTGTAGSLARTAIFTEFALKVTAGGDDSTMACAVTVRWTDRYGGAGLSSYDYEISVRFDTAGFSVYDQNGAALVDSPVAIDMTTELRVRVVIDSSGYLRTWYARSGHVRSWAAGPDHTALTNAGATANDPRVVWGHQAAPAADTTSVWTMAAYCMWASRWNSASTDSPGKTWANPTQLHTRSLPTRPALVYDGVRVHGTDGPAVIGDYWRIGARYDYPITAAMWEEDPSPRVRWRSTADEIDAYLVWDTTAMSSGGRLLNHTVGMMLAGCNFKSAKLQGWDGAAWQDIGTLDMTVISAAPYRRDGDVIYVDTGSSFTGANYIDHSAYVGGTVELDATTRRKIVAHTAGAWTNQTTKRPWFRLDGIVDTEPTTGTCRVVAPAGVLVVHEHNTDYRYLRLLIPSYATAANYYQIGLCVIGHVEVLGFSPNRERKIRHDHPADLVEFRDGSSRARSRGPRRRTVDLAWEDGVDEQTIRAASAVPDYVGGTSAGLPAGTKYDTVSHVLGLLDSLDGPVRPVVYLPRIDRTTGSISIVDPAQFIWGRLGAKISQETVTGLEGRTAIDRLMTLSIEEIP